MNNDFISIEETLPGINKLCDVQLKSGSVKQARLIQDAKTYKFNWVDNNYVFSAYATHWRYNENTCNEETKAFFKKWANKGIK